MLSYPSENPLALKIPVRRVYQQLAEKAAELSSLGMKNYRIGERLGVDHVTIKRAIAWWEKIQSEPDEVKEACSPGPSMEKYLACAEEVPLSEQIAHDAQRLLDFGLSLTEVADYLGVSRSMVQHATRNTRK